MAANEKTKAETEADANKAKVKAEADAAAAVRARTASGENEEAPPKVAVVPRSAAEAVAKPVPRNAVMVGCKLPHGITLSLHEAFKNEEERVIFRPTGDTVTLAGRNASQIIGGYGITPVDENWWDAWVQQNQNYQPYKMGLIFAEPRRDRAMDRALDQRSLLTGSEPIDPDKPGKGLTRVSEAEQRSAQAMGNG
jgi:hypothetical protein